MEKKKGNAKAQAEMDAKFAKYANKLGVQGTSSNQGTKKPKTNNERVVRNAARQGKKVEVVQKSTGNKVSQIDNVGKLLDEDMEIKEVPREIAIQVAQVRNEKKLSQEQLARKISENVAVISALERCEGVYNPKVVTKIEKALDVKFTRSWKK